jgi:hypothetical protein
MPPRFTDREGHPIAVGDVVLVYSNDGADYDGAGWEDQAMFMGRVLRTERGFLVVRDQDADADVDVFPEDCGVAPRDQWYRVESEKSEKWVGFVRQVGLPVEEDVEDFDPKEVEQIAHAALRSYDATWFKGSRFFYTPEDGTWYKEWHDRHWPGWAYRMRVIPQPVSKSEGSWVYDVEWLYLAPTEPPNNKWVVFDQDHEHYIDGVSANHAVGVRKILGGEMRWETEKI